MLVCPETTPLQIINNMRIEYNLPPSILSALGALRRPRLEQLRIWVFNNTATDRSTAEAMCRHFLSMKENQLQEQAKPAYKWHVQRLLNGPEGTWFTICTCDSPDSVGEIIRAMMKCTSADGESWRILSVRQWE